MSEKHEIKVGVPLNNIASLITVFHIGVQSQHQQKMAGNYTSLSSPSTWQRADHAYLTPRVLWHLSLISKPGQNGKPLSYLLGCQGNHLSYHGNISVHLGDN